MCRQTSCRDRRCVETPVLSHRRRRAHGRSVGGVISVTHSIGVVGVLLSVTYKYDEMMIMCAFGHFRPHSLSAHIALRIPITNLLL